MSRATHPLKLPHTVKRAAQRLAKEDGVSLNQWIAAAVAEKVGVVETAAAFFKKRAGNAKGDRLLKFLRRARQRAARIGRQDHLAVVYVAARFRGLCFLGSSAGKRLPALLASASPRQESQNPHPEKTAGCATRPLLFKRDPARIECRASFREPSEALFSCTCNAFRASVVDSPRSTSPFLHSASVASRT
jgi:hypothetical protein